MSDVARIREDFLQLWGRLGPAWGISPTTARVYSFLVAQTEEEASGGDELARELELSRGAVSMACRELVEWGLVHATRPAGSRRVVYRAETEPEKFIRAIVATRKRREWDPLRERLDEWTNELKKDRSKEASRLLARLEDLHGIVSLVDSMAEAFLQGGALQKVGLKALVRGARNRTPKEQR